MSTAVPSDLYTTHSDYLLKLIVVGTPGAGKSSLILRFSDDVFTAPYIITIGIEFVSVPQKIKTVDIDRKSAKLQVWDGVASACERYRTVSAAYYRNAAICLVVVDLADRLSLQGVEEQVSETRKHCSEAVIEIVGCKSDLPRQVSREELLGLASRLHTLCVETSAKEGENVDAAFLDAAKEAIRRIGGRAENACRNSG